MCFPSSSGWKKFFFSKKEEEENLVNLIQIKYKTKEEEAEQDISKSSSWIDIDKIIFFYIWNDINYILLWKIEIEFGS